VSAGSSRRERRVAGLNLEVGQVHLGGGAIGPVHRCYHHRAVGVIGAMAVTVPLAKGPLLVGASGPLTIAIDCRKARV
jgi:hypothetical protein